jgi:hypothetical protein
MIDPAQREVVGFLPSIDLTDPAGCQPPRP